MTIEEALAASEAEPVNDIFTVNPESRTITVPDTEKIFGVFNDGNTERKHFRCPKVVGDSIDLTTLHLYINYQNANGKKYPYLVEDVQPDGDYITFSWLISQDVVAYKGTVKFVMCAKKGTELEWNTTLAEGTVLEGLEATDEVVERHPDIIEQILTRLDNVTEITQDKEQSAVDQYMTDYTAMMKQINSLKEDIVDYLHIDSDNIFDPSKVTKNKYINSNGEELDASSYELSEYIPVPFVGDNYLYFNKNAVSSEYSDFKGVHQIILYDSNKIFIKRVSCAGALYGAFNQANAKHMRLMIGSNTKDLMVVVSNKYDASFSPTYIPYGGAYTETFKNEVNETLKKYANSEEFKDNINSVIDKRQENDTERPLEHIIRDGGLTRIFRTAGVVGDSLSSGCMEYKDSSGNALGYDRYEFSWIQQMRGICGFDRAENFSVGGLTSKTFWTTQSQKVKNLREDGANHKCQLYFIALGVNDIADTTMEVGTPNDISNDSSTTFYGYYSRIIKLIQRHQPKARIFLVGLPNHNKMTIWGKRFTDFKKAIADMVNHFNFVYYLDLYQYESAYDSEFQKIYFNGFHENALGYARTAWVISSYVDWYIRHNYEEFREVGFIGTDYHYYD